MSDSAAADHCRSTLATDQVFRAARQAVPRPTAAATGAAWVVHTAANGSTLPGRVVRTAGDPASGDAAVDEAADGITATLALYRDAFARVSYDGKGAEVLLTVHYQRNYDNAFWNGTQLVFGDGDGTVFGSFTKPVDVLGHEFTHAVTQFTADLTYQGQSGALNESVSDCFGMCVKQQVLGQTAATADWLVGEGIFLPGINARALRDMAHPGTAYDDPTLGKDPQVGDMADYVDTTDDNGGVHTNSGIPNRAFYLAATAIGGDTWEGAGRSGTPRSPAARSRPTPTSPASRPRPLRLQATMPPPSAVPGRRSGWIRPAGQRRPSSAGEHRPPRSSAYAGPGGSPGGPSRAPSTSPPTTREPRQPATWSTGST